MADVILVELSDRPSESDQPGTENTSGQRGTLNWVSGSPTGSIQMSQTLATVAPPVAMAENE